MRACARELGAGAQARERADVAGAVRDDAVEVAVRMHHRAGRERRVADAAERADADFVAELDEAFEDHVDVDLDVAPDAHVAADVEAHGIGETDAGRGERRRAKALVEPLERRELPRVVRAEHFLRVRALRRFGRLAFLVRLREDVGEVVLALRVLVGQVVDPDAKAPRVGGEDPAS